MTIDVLERWYWLQVKTLYDDTLIHQTMGRVRMVSHQLVGKLKYCIAKSVAPINNKRHTRGPDFVLSNRSVTIVRSSKRR